MNQNNSKSSLNLQTSYAQIWKIAYPIIIGSIAQNLIALTDIAFLGRVGENELAAIGYVSLFYLLLYTIGYGYTKGTQILVARRAGENKPHQIGPVLDNSFFVVTLFSLLIFVLLWFFTQPLFSAILNNQEVVAYCDDYLKVRAWGVWPSFLGTVLLAFYTGLGRMQIIIWNVIVISVVNIFLNWILIFGHFGFLEMGVTGAAIASTIAEVIGFFIFVGYSLVKRHYQEFQFYKLAAVNRDTINTVNNLSAPIVGQFLIGLGAWFSFFTMIEKLGSRELAISNILRNLYSLAGMTTWGFASAANTVVSNVIGQGKYDDVKPTIKRIVYLSLGFAVIQSFILAIIPRAILRVYTNDFSLIEDSLAPLYICIVALPLFSISTILFNSIVSTGLTRVSLLIETMAICFYLVYIYFVIMVYHSEVWMAWTSEWIYWALIGSFALYYLKSGKWKNVKI